MPVGSLPRENQSASRKFAIPGCALGPQDSCGIPQHPSATPVKSPPYSKPTFPRWTGPIPVSGPGYRPSDLEGQGFSAFWAGERPRQHEERVIAGAREVAVVGRALLHTVRRAHAAVDVEHQRGSCALPMHAVDPPPREIGQRRQVRRRRHRARLEAAHLARGRRLVCHPPAADHPAQRIAGSRPSRSASFTSS
jgi:hypothetical protein